MRISTQPFILGQARQAQGGPFSPPLPTGWELAIGCACFAKCVGRAKGRRYEGLAGRARRAGAGGSTSVTKRNSLLPAFAVTSQQPEAGK